MILSPKMETYKHIKINKDTLILLNICKSKLLQLEPELTNITDDYAIKKALQHYKEAKK